MPRGHDLEALLAAGRAGDAHGLPRQSEQSDRHLVQRRRTRRLPGAACRRDVLVVVDEAYLEFVTDPALPSALLLLERFPNLVVTRTFSQGLCAWRACASASLAAHSELVAVMERVRESFNVNAPALAAAEAALDDQEHLDGVREAQCRGARRAGRRACAHAACRSRRFADQFPAGRLRSRGRADRSAPWSRAASCCGRWAATACRLPAHHGRQRATRTRACCRRWTRCWHEPWRLAAPGTGRPLRGRDPRPRRQIGLAPRGDAGGDRRGHVASSTASSKARTPGPPRRILGQLGVRIEAPSARRRIVHGVGLHGLQGSRRAARLWQCRHRHAPAGRPAGRAGIRQRAGRRRLAVAAADAAGDRRRCRRMGARIDTSAGGLPPLANPR